MSQTAPTPPEGFTNVSIPPSKQQKGKKLIPLFLGLLVIGSGFSYKKWFNIPNKSVNILKISGRIEGYKTEIGIKRSGRIESITVREGAYAKKGQVLIKLDDSKDQLLREQLRGTEARIVSAQSDKGQVIADLNRVRSEFEQIDIQISEAKLNLQQSQGDTIGRIEQAKANVSAAKAQLIQVQAQAKQAAAEVKLARMNSDRYKQLIKEGAINRQQFYGSHALSG